ncbi:MAG: prepilin-type N-terminal cleavage/methylation domain-containing protein [Candidatus Zipacnadales bacterium]
MKRLRSGFTLIELLVAIAIIAILASILFPVFSRARAQARQTNCLSNIKQLSLAIEMYCQDYDEVLIPSASRPISGSTPNTALIWPAYLKPYLKSEQLFVCPEARGQGWYVEIWGERGRLPYGLNRDLEDRTNERPYAMAVFGEPATTIVLADSACGNTGSPERMRGFQVMADRRPNTQSGIAARHSEGTNVGFLDGHAKCYQASRIWQMANPAGLKWTP